MSPRLLLPAIGILLIYSCIEDNNLFPDPLYPQQETFKSSIFSTVTDTSGIPIVDAEVRIGSVTGLSDDKGYVYFDRVSVGKSSYMTIEKEGFFHASRRFYPTEGVVENIRVMLLPLSRKAFFSSSSGATFVDGELRIKFPANGYSLPNGDAYSGTVLVYSATIEADDPDLSYKMPGDLVGITSDGSYVALASMGMFAVELRSASGELLELKEGVEAEVQMNVTSSLTNLPVNIPLWHFDEASGIWREEGQAVLSGNTYIGSVKHFSYWNYDAQFPIVKWGTQILYSTSDRNDPAIYAEVCITILSLNIKKCATTNSDGSVCGMVAANELLQLDVYNSCQELVYSEVVGPYSDTTMMAPIFIIPPQSSSVTGLAIDCDGHPVENGYAILDNGIAIYIPLEQGTFSTTFTTCNELPFSVYVVNTDKLTESKVYYFEPDYFVNADTIVVCDDLTEFIVFNIDGYPDQIVVTDLDYRHTEDGHFIWNYSNYDSIHSVHFEIEPSLIGIYNTDECHINLIEGEKRFHNDIAEIKLEQFGNVGDMIKGRIKGILFTDQSMTGYAYTAQFSVQRF